MGWKTSINRILKFDLETNQLGWFFEIKRSIVTNKGTVLIEEGPLFIKCLTEFAEVESLLSERAIKKLTKETE